MGKPLNTGDLAVITENTRSSDGDDALRAGHRFIVDEYVSAEEAEQEQGYYIGTTCNSGNSGDVCVDEQFVRLETPASELAARTAPTVEQLRQFLGGALLDEDDNLAIHQASNDGDRGIEIFGRTADGLPFGATLQITTIFETDF